MTLSYAQLHPITQEPMLTYAAFQQMLELLAHTQKAVLLGGDVLDAQERHLYLNWYYETDASLSYAENVKQSCKAAQRFIRTLSEPAQYLYIPVFDKYPVCMAHQEVAHDDR